MKLNPKLALVILSGGQDSTTCLHWAIKRWGQINIKTVTFNYGQKHQQEIDAARQICQHAGVDFDLINIPNILRSTSPLIDKSQELASYQSIEEFKPGVEATFVPGRNILFLTIAANLAMHHGAQHLVMGVCQEDFGGYYDCRQEFTDAMQKALNQGLLGHNQGLEIHTPLMHLTKSQSVKLAQDLGEQCLEAIALSRTCYAGVHPPCGKCHACLLRARGFREAGINDPAISLML